MQGGRRVVHCQPQQQPARSRDIGDVGQYQDIPVAADGRRRSEDGNPGKGQRGGLVIPRRETDDARVPSVLRPTTRTGTEPDRIKPRLQCPNYAVRNDTFRTCIYLSAFLISFPISV